MFRREFNWVDAIVGLILSIGVGFLNALYALCFWNWFISPLFPHIHMTYWWLIGISMALSFIFSLAKSRDKIDTSDSDWPFITYVVVKTIINAIIFGIGAIIYAIAF